MATKPASLRDFIRLLEDHDALARIEVPVSPELEIAEITDRISKAPAPQNKGLLFMHPDGATMPVALNLFGSHQRMKLALGLEPTHDADYSELQQRLLQFIKPPKAASMIDKLKLLPMLADAGKFFPKTVKSAPCQEVVVTDTAQPMLDMLPILTCWPQDGGPFITMPVVFTKDPETGHQNAGMYRLQKYDNCTTGMHWHKHHDGNRLYEAARRAGKDYVEVAVALGAPPHVVYAATAPLPPGIDEMIFAGFLHQSPVDMVPCKTVDLEVPAQSEIILEGRVPVDELRWEGPFGDHTGVYSLADDFPVFHLTAVTHRHNPIYLTTIVGKPPQEDLYLGGATEHIFLPLLNLFIPEITDMHMPAEGVFHNCLIVSMEKRYPGHTRKIMHSIWGFGQLMFSKYIIVVDADVDVRNLSDVAWRVFNHTDPKRDTVISEGPLDILDHACPRWAYGSKLGIDATIKTAAEDDFQRDWPDEIVMDEATRQKVDQRWADYFSQTHQKSPRQPVSV
ncbi:MAG: menaquinone biosynthesis decarboxylase [Cyanobacteria bacterium HKST-UBA06]|nr:menaquinone biosynthesis decarboxylase [Cyanobacteria bacterium HKST-UBA06]